MRIARDFWRLTSLCAAFRAVALDQLMKSFDIGFSHGMRQATGWAVSLGVILASLNDNSLKTLAKETNSFPQRASINPQYPTA